MDQVKRKLTSNQSSEEKAKKLRNEFDRPITGMENLSNEFFYEIFDYLDGCEIYAAFSNLNHRFQQLLNSSCLLFKINLDTSTSEELLINNFKHIVLHKSHQIYSIHLSTSENFNEIFSSLTIDSSFNRLQSLVLDDIDPDMLNSLLINLICLPRLLSLDINASDSLEELGDFYRLVFALPKLRHLIFSTEVFEDFKTTISLPISTYQQFSTIKDLYISHCCTFNEIFAIISYTPQLCHLYFMYKNDKNSKIETILPITLSNLTYISIDGFCERFDIFEIFITKIYSKLKVLCLSIFTEDMNYLDANRWEQLILQYSPPLKKFCLQYHMDFVDDDESQMYLGEPNQIISSFWIERQWVFEVAVYSENISYLIQPYRKRWYEYTQTKIINSSIQLSKSVRLTLMYFPSEEYLHLSRIINNRILTVAQIYHLEIHNKIFVGKLIEILFSLLELDSLYVSSLSLSKPKCLSSQYAETLSFISSKNQITKVNLEKMINIEEVYFLIKLCPRMIYLQVNHINNMDMELFIRLILIKSNDHLRLLSFRVPAADDEMIKTLEKMINSEKLLFDYTIKRILGNIYLQWK